ncbi:hypothetical protein [Niabella hibiscisoli]|uniref:hypothetical protein n=1 Tax=Niabella hibiscisoli TaxID=1825928 RepID=UPI001F103079|nr:hypothetical protein [Niabella hibiscisoli]MCH5716981.1 hypothetical protein [Niabella hibiscisoli]
MEISNSSSTGVTLSLTDNAYGKGLQQYTIGAGANKSIKIDLKKAADGTTLH